MDQKPTFHLYTPFDSSLGTVAEPTISLDKLEQQISSFAHEVAGPSLTRTLTLNDLLPKEPVYDIERDVHPQLAILDTKTQEAIAHLKKK
ncbi:hypothetical protein GEMRC1_000121 [Eukaryota sp. GEM-RC1]